MAVHDDLVELEHVAWTALSTSPDAALAFYEDVLAADVLMLLPGGMVIDERQQVLASMGGPPWDSFVISKARTLPLTDSSAVVAYEATAQRGGTTYRALFNSTYVHDGARWRLALHQQTPI